MSPQGKKLNLENHPSLESSLLENENTKSPPMSKKQDSLVDCNQNVILKTKTIATSESRNSDLENPSRWGWVVVAAGCLLMTPVAGCLASFGNFVGPLSEEFGASKFLTGLVGSLPYAVGLGLTPVTTWLINKYGTRPVCSVGALLYLIGIFSSSYVSHANLLFFTYSILSGIGLSCSFNPTMLLVGKYFLNKHQAIATSLATCGISIGSLVINPFMGMVIESLGWRATWRVFSAILLAVQIISIALYRDPVSDTDKQASKEKRDVEKMEMIESNQNVKTTEIAKTNTSELLRNPGIILWLIGTLCWSCSFIFPLIFLVDFIETTFAMEAATANQVLIVYGVSELAGRILGGFCAEKVKFSLTYIYVGFTIAAGICTCVTPFIHSIGWMYVYGLAAGITAGVANSIQFATSMQLFGHHYGKSIWGYTNVMVAIGAVSGPISAGKIYDVTKSYTIAFEVGGGLFILSGVVMLTIETIKKRFPLKNGDQMEENEKSLEEVKIDVEKC